MNIANVLELQGVLQPALDKYHEALPVLEATLGRNHLHVATTCTNIGAVYQEQQKYPEALELYSKCRN